VHVTNIQQSHEASSLSWSQALTRAESQPGTQAKHEHMPLHSLCSQHQLEQNKGEEAVWQGTDRFSLDGNGVRFLQDLHLQG